MKSSSTLSNYLKGLIDPYITGIVVALESLNKRVIKVPNTSVVIHHGIAVSTISPHILQSAVHEWTINSNIVLTSPNLPTDWSSGFMTLYLSSTNSSGGSVALGANVIEEPGDGLIIPFGETYIYSLKMIRLNNDSSAVTTYVSTKKV